MEYGNIAQWSGLFLTGLLFIATLIGHRSRAAKDEVEKIDQRLIDLRQDVEKVKSEMDHMPTKDVVHEIMLSIARMEQELKQVKAISERTQDYMMEGGRK